MDWNWNAGSHKKGKGVSAGVNKLHDEWLWQPAKSSGRGDHGGNAHVGELLEDEIYPCNFCNGTGERPKGSKCPVCKGKGVITVVPPAVKCAYCKGKGEDKPRSIVTCSACRGKGIMHVDTPIEVCGSCQGTGKNPGNRLVCMSCRGKGVVTQTLKQNDGLFDTNTSNIPTSSHKFVGSATGSEREALVAIKRLGSCDRVAVARNIAHPVSSTYAEMICDSLAKKGLLIRDGRIYSLTPDGEIAAGK